MLDLTFGEQVKLVLSRKGMTIKELAEIIEKRTGKKMSRQNLTQRLGRDNFQEQDMRMIAEILECPFRLSILADQEEAEGAESERQESERPKPVKTVQKTTKESVRIAKAKARKEKKAKEAERLADAIEQVPSEIRRKPIEKEMTLGDYLDIHEELVRQETEKLPKVSEEERGVPEASEDSDNLYQEDKDSSGERLWKESVSREEAVQERDGLPYGSTETESVQERDALGHENAETVQEETTQEENVQDGNLQEGIVTEASVADESSEPQEVCVAEESFEPQEASAAEESSGLSEALGDSKYPEVDVEELLREMEELERERKLLEQQEQEARQAREAKAQEEPPHEEKKITGWRAMFQRRSKKERQEELREEAKIVEQVIEREPTIEELEDDDVGYQEPEAVEESLEEPEVQQTAEDLLEELIGEEEDAEDLSIGELNPYTGHEYETNSVRMHPKRIGYVQLYDRRDHGWTDMTEWAFLGYQERKKVLLGKDYDPPIYLD